MNSKNKFIIAISGIVILVFFWIYWISVSSDDQNPTLVKYLSVDQLLAEETKSRVKLGGNVQDGTIQIPKDNQLEVTFVLEQGEYSIPVFYKGIRPDLFKDGVEVIVEGTYAEGIFTADQLQTKCASRYEGDLRDESSYNLDEI